MTCRLGWMVGWSVGLGVAAVAGAEPASPAGKTTASPVVGWRMDATGQFPGTQPPLKWSPTENVVWKTDLGAWSNASPVVSGDRVFVQAEPTRLVCVSLADGKVLWEADNSYKEVGLTEPPPKTHATNGYSSPTPTTDGQRVYALFSNGVTACYDLDGKRQWIKLVERSPGEKGWGNSASPVLVGDKLIVCINDMTALNAKDGSEAWKVANKPSWGSPIAARIGGEEVIVSPAGQIVRAKDGKVLASGLGELTYNAPVIHDGVLYYLSNKAAAYALPAKANADGTLTLKPLWQRELNKDRYYSSSVVANGRIYAVTRGQELTVLNAADGQTVWEKKLDLEGRKPNEVYSSFCLAGGKLYLTSDPGETVVLEPGDSYKELARNKLGTCRSTPVFLGKRMLIRADKFLYCIGQ